MTVDPRHIIIRLPVVTLVAFAVAVAKASTLAWTLGIMAHVAFTALVWREGYICWPRRTRIGQWLDANVVGKWWAG